MRKLYPTLTPTEGRVHFGLTSLCVVLFGVFMAPLVSFWVGAAYILAFSIFVSIAIRLLILWVRD